MHLFGCFLVYGLSGAAAAVLLMWVMVTVLGAQGWGGPDEGK